MSDTWNTIPPLGTPHHPLPDPEFTKLPPKPDVAEDHEPEAEPDPAPIPEK